MIFQPTYFSPIYQFQQLVNADNIVFEVCDSYQKQSYRTRLNIYSPNGVQSLIIPIKHQSGIKQLTKDIKIENTYKWQRNHLKSLQNSYRSSPFFEFYEDDLITLYKKEEKFLLDFLLKSQELAFEMLQIEPSISKTTQFIKEYTKEKDFRFLDSPKIKKKFNLNHYTQVFIDKHGFLPNLSILDLLFNEGSNAISLLKINN